MNTSVKRLKDQTLAQYLADWACQFEYSQLPHAVSSICKKALLDVTAVGIAGVDARVSQSAQALAHRFFNDKKQEASLFNGKQCSAKHAAYCNAIFAHAFDMDDTCFAGIVHASVVIGPVVLAFAQANHKSGEQVLTAFAVGSEISYALGMAAGFSLYKNNWWPTGLLGVIGAAAALAKLKGCDEQTMSRAIAFAALNASPFRCLHGTDSKPLAIGETVKRAIDALEVAQTNVSVPVDVFERAQGPFKVTVGEKFNQQQVMQLGEQYRLIDPGLVVKLFPLCSCAQACVETLIEIVRQNDLNQKDIESVCVVTTSMVQKTLCFDSPKDENQAMFSLTYPLACVLIDRTVKPQHISLTSINREDIKAAMTKVSYKVEDNLFDLNESPEAAIVTVTTRQGETFVQRRLYPTGDPRSPATKAQFRTKIESCLGSNINIDNFINAFDNMEQHSSINFLADLIQRMNQNV